MKEIKAYKSDSGHVFESKKDALLEDARDKIFNTFSGQFQQLYKGCISIEKLMIAVEHHPYEIKEFAEKVIKAKKVES